MRCIAIWVLFASMVAAARLPLFERQANATCDAADPVLSSIVANPDPTGYCYSYLALSTVTVTATRTAYDVVTQTTPITGVPLTQTTTFSPPVTTRVSTVTITNSAFTVTFTTTRTTPDARGCTQPARLLKRQSSEPSQSICSTLMSQVYAVIVSGGKTMTVPVPGTQIPGYPSQASRTANPSSSVTSTPAGSTSTPLGSSSSDMSQSQSTSEGLRTASNTFAPSAISSACGCLSVATPESTYVITTTTMPTVTFTSTIHSYVTSTPVVTETPMVTTVLAPVTVTTTENVAVSACPCGPVTGTAPVFLSAPTKISAADIDDADDGYITIDLDGTSVGLYGQFPDTIRMSVNGFLALVNDPAVSSNNVPLPNFPPPQNGPGTYLPGTAIAPLWDDYTLEGNNTNLGLYYQFDPSPTALRARNVTFEWYVNSFTSRQPYHFLTRLEEARPNIVSFTFLQIPGSGSFGTSGVQSKQAGNKFAQLSFDEADLIDGSVVEFDADSNSFEYVQFGVCQAGT